MSGLTASFVAAVQASLSVLLVILYGAVAARCGLLNATTTRTISKICVRMFLPALLFTNIGAQLHAGSAHRYGVVLVWAAVTHALSLAVGLVGHRGLGMPDWTTVAVLFNNTTSYPLLLIAALGQTGILQVLVSRPGHDADEPAMHAALARAKSYFLVYSTVSSCLTFAIGPRLIDTEHPPDTDDEDTASEADGKLVDEERGADDMDGGDGDDEAGSASGSSGGLLDAGRPSARLPSEACDPLYAAAEPATPRTPPSPTEATEQTALLRSRPSVIRFVDPFAGATPRASATNSAVTTVRRRLSVVPRRRWVQLSPRARWWLLFVGDFFNAPLLGALAGAAVGLTPVLHGAFFGPGGLFTAWLTASLDDIGALFVPLPVVVAGVSLYTAAQTRRASAAGRGSGSGSGLPRMAVAFVLLVRFVVWPLASIAAIYWLVSHTTLLGDDPMLWFALMLMPTGPPAMKLITLVQVSDGDAAAETSIAKLLTISYLVSPILSLTVVGSLRASEACLPP